MSKILLIDDEESIVNILSISLRSDGYNVVSASTGSQGIELYKKENPDIVITDLRMPGMDGLEVLKNIKKLDSGAEVIIITGHGDLDSAIEALEYGASDFINKPIKDNALAIALSRAREKIKIREKLRGYTSSLEAKIEAATREIKRRVNFQTKLISSSNNGIVATDENGNIVIYNPGAELIFGYPGADTVDKMRYDDIFPDDIARELEAGLNNAKIIRNTPWSDTEIISRDGEKVPVRYSGSILYQGGIVMGSVVSLQDRREIRRLEDELIRSERLAAIGQTVAGLAHYIKNILTGLKGGSYIFNIGLKNNRTEKINEGWEMVQKNITRISDLVMDLLNFSKKREVDPHNCSPNRVVREICDLMKIRASENDIELVINPDPSIGDVFLDEEIIHHTLLNLVTNAIDACIFDADRSKEWKVEITTRKNDGEIIFQVTDNGCGISEAVTIRIFTSFFTTKKGKGTGLGLLTTKKLVEEHKGSIYFTSKEGEGTTFTVKLPIKEAADLSGGQVQEKLH